VCVRVFGKPTYGAIPPESQWTQCDSNVLERLIDGLSMLAVDIERASLPARGEVPAVDSNAPNPEPEGVAMVVLTDEGPHWEYAARHKEGADALVQELRRIVQVTQRYPPYHL
jgi:hypothetical protein